MQLKEVYLELKGQNYFQVLGLPTEFTPAKLRSARRKLSAKYHPDKFDNKEEKELAGDISSIINEAFEALSDEAFVEEYLKSGLQKKYTTSQAVTVVKSSEDSNKLSRARGATLTASAVVPFKTLLEGGTIEVTPIIVEGLDVDNSPRTVEIPKNTKDGSFLVYANLGEQLENGNSGDLIVNIMCEEDLVGLDKETHGVSSNPIYLELSKALDKGKNEVTLSEELSLSAEIDKTTEADEFVYIVDTPLDKPVLLKV